MVLVLRLLEELSWRIWGRWLWRDLNELDENAVDCVRVEERDPGAVGAAPRGVVDQADPGRARLRQRPIDVRHLERQMVNAFPPPGQEPAQGAGGIQGFKQLDLGVRQVNKRDPDVLLAERIPRLF